MSSATLIAQLARPSSVHMADDASARVAASYLQQLCHRLGPDLDVPAAVPPHWRPELGVIARHSRLRARLAALQLHLLAMPGIAGDTCVDVGAPGALYFEGHCIPVAGQVRIGEDLQVRWVDSALGCWQLPYPEAVRPVVVPPHHPRQARMSLHGAGPRYLVDAGSGTPAGVFPDPLRGPENTAGAPSASFGAHAAAVADAVQLLQDTCPAYSRWVGSVVTGVLVTADSVDCALSSPEHPGLLAVRGGRDVLDYIEMIVAGACQQKLYQMAMVASLSLPDSEQIHYLPHRRWYTTSRRALAALHEHHNVLGVLTGIARQQGPEADLECRISRRRLMRTLDGLVPLQNDHTLSASGMVLCNALREQAATCG